MVGLGRKEWGGVTEWTVHFAGVGDACGAQQPVGLRLPLHRYREGGQGGGRGEAGGGLKSDGGREDTRGEWEVGKARAELTVEAARTRS